MAFSREWSKIFKKRDFKKRGSNIKGGSDISAHYKKPKDQNEPPRYAIECRRGNSKKFQIKISSITTSTDVSILAVKKIKKFQKLGITDPVRGKSTSVNTIVLFLKNNGNVRFCTDMKVANKVVASWCSGYHHCTTSFKKVWTQVLRRFKSYSRRVRDSQSWGSLTMAPAENKAKRFSLVNHTTKAIHHHHYHHHHHHQR